MTTTPLASLARPLVRIGALLSMLACARCAGTLDDPAAFRSTSSDAGAVDAAAAPEAAATAPCPDIPTTFAQSCAASGCHDATTRAEALDLVSPGVASRLVGVAAAEGIGLLIDPGTPSHSVVYTKLTASPPFGARMPTGTALDEATVQCVLAWVTTQAMTSTPPAGDGGTLPPPDAGSPDAAHRDGGSTSPFTTVRVAAGQSAAVTDAQGHKWSADADFTGGTEATQSPPIAIAGTDAPALYNGQRYGNPSFVYQFAVPDGMYSVTLKFAELYVTGPGMRIFGIDINGATVEPSLDIYAAAGAMNTAVDRSYPVAVTGGQIKIAFNQGSVQFPKVDAIEIRQGASDGGP